MGRMPITSGSFDDIEQRSVNSMNVSALSAMGQRFQDFEALQNTLQSGNLNAAQRAFAAFQQDVQKTAQMAGANSIFSPGTQASKDLQDVGGQLRSANLPGAQKAFATLLQDIQTAGQSPANLPFLHNHHPTTPTEIATKGALVSPAPALGGSAAQAISDILSKKA